jgi:hypothetical protein
MTNEEKAVIAALVNGVSGDEIFAQPATWTALRSAFPLEAAAGVVNDIEDYIKDE